MLAHRDSPLIGAVQVITYGRFPRVEAWIMLGASRLGVVTGQTHEGARYQADMVAPGLVARAHLKRPQFKPLVKAKERRHASHRIAS